MMWSILAKFSKKTAVVTLMMLIICSILVPNGVPANNPMNNPANNNDALHAASSKFSFKLYNQIRKQRTGNNTFVSPTSVMLALAMTYNGADGKTRDAMAQTLELQGMTLDEANRAFAELRTTLASPDPKVQLNIANSLWAKEGFTVKPEFLKRNKDFFDADITNLDFASPRATETINSWVSKNTDGKIQKIVDRIKPEMVLFLINAIYFKGQWQFEFDKKNTNPDTFKLSGGAQKQVPMMSQSSRYNYYRGKDFQAVALPYGQGRVSMYVFLPDEQISLEQFEQNLTPENWDTWMKEFRVRPGDIMLPRFKVEWESDLNDALKAMGMTEAFDPTRANFSQIAKVGAGANLYISEVKHKTFGEVNEEGTVAAAVTSVGVGLTSVQAPPQKFNMKVDRPFFFAIRDNATGVLLFMGSITNPE